MNQLAPIAGINRNPVMGLRPSDMQVVPCGRPYFELQPDPGEGLLILLVNGAVISRLTVEQRLEVNALEQEGKDVSLLLRAYAEQADNWRNTLTQPGDIMHWEVRPLGRENIRVLLTVAIVVAAITQQYYLIPYLTAANVAYNLLVPPKQPPQAERADEVFNTALSGNQARLDQPIWKVCGRVRITPPFACQPYVEFLPSNPSKPTKNCDQYFYAVYAISEGDVDIEKDFIGKTPVIHFQDVTVAQKLAPGVQPTEAEANVTSSVSELQSAELVSEENNGVFSARYVGGFVACRPKDRASRIGIDVTANTGLYGTGGQSRTAVWQVEYREINDFGMAIDEWFVLANESRTDDTPTPQRWSNTYTLPRAMRVEIRLVRTDLLSDDPEFHDAIQWVGLRAYLATPAPLNANVTHYELVIRASEQISTYGQTDLSMIVRGKCRTWDPLYGWSAPAFNRNPAWWLADLWTNPVWGEGLPDERVDLLGIYEWSLVLDARQDHFDLCIDASRDSWELAQVIAAAGRARPFRRNGIYTIARDEMVDLPLMAISSRNAVRGLGIQQTLPTHDAPDGVIIEYQNYITSEKDLIECPCPGYTVTDPTDPRYDALLPSMANPIYQKLEGVVGPKHAEREGLYQAYSLALRQATVSATVEMEGALAHFMAPIRFQPKMVGYGQTGDVVFWDAASLIMTLSEPPIFGSEPVLLTLIRDDGSLTTPVEVLPGPGANDIELPALPDFDIDVDDSERDRTKFLLGTETGDELAKVTSIRDGGDEEGATLFDIEALIDDDRVHTADNHLLPSPGEIQDPIDDGIDYPDTSSATGGGYVTVVRYSGQTVDGGSLSVPFTGGFAGIKFLADGRLQVAAEGGFLDPPVPTWNTIPGEWLNTSPVEPGVSAQYEIMYETSELERYAPYSVGSENVWLSLSTDRQFSINVASGFGAVTGYISIRRTGASTVLVRRRTFLFVHDGPPVSTGGL